MDKSRYLSVSLRDAIIINIPVLLFLSGGGLGLTLGLSSFLNHRIMYFLAAWWCLCGAVMLSVDYIKRKKQYFQRLYLLSLSKQLSPDLHVSLKSTFCGFCLLLALKRRLRLANKINMEEFP